MIRQVIHNKKVGVVLEEVALFLELKGENPFKVKSFLKGRKLTQILRFFKWSGGSYEKPVGFWKLEIEQDCQKCLPQ
jgi:hypothetical protein